MADRRRTSETQMADLNAQLVDQNQTIKNMMKVANQTDAVTTDIQAELYRQRGVIDGNIEKVYHLL